MVTPSRILQFGLSLAMLNSCSSEKQQEAASNAIRAQYPLSELSSKSEKDVARFIGKGKRNGVWKDTESGCTDCPKMSYRSDSVEVIFINGKSDRLTLNHLQNYDFTNEMIMGLLGLPESVPTFDNGSDIKRWERYHGFRSISAFGDKGKINYILVLSNAE